MRSSPSRSRSPALLLAAVALLAPARAAAQACCGGGASLAPARLEVHERALVGLQIKAAYLHGSFDGARRYLASPSGSVELDLEQDFVAAVRVLDRGQLSLLVPMVETYRKVPGIAEGGGDLGDLQLAARWDFVFAGRSRVPGIALAAGFVAPTGRAPEAARKPLATDATGSGAAQLAATLSLEQIFGSFLVNLTGSVTWRGARIVGSLREQQGVQLVVSVVGGYLFTGGGLLALTAAYTAELAPRLDGRTIPGGGRAATRLGLAGGYAFTEVWRMQATAFADMPLRFLGWNQPAATGLSFVLLRSFS